MTARIRPARADDLGALEQVENDADRILVDRLRPEHWGAAPTGEERAAQPGFLLVADTADESGAGEIRADVPAIAGAGAGVGAEVGAAAGAGAGVGGVVGFVHVLEAEGHCHLEQLSVAPAHARQGLGRALVEAAMREAAARGHRRMSLRTYADVPWNAPFYRTLGFADEEPASAFHHALAAGEAEAGLDGYGRRIQLAVDLTVPAPTERLRFRRMAETDLDAMAALLGDPEVMRYYPAPKTREGAASWIAWNRENYDTHGHGLWIVETHAGDFVGDCGLTWQQVGGAPALEVGYHVRAELQGRGHATEAAVACREYAAERGLASSLVAIIHPGNRPSQRVAEKLGMTRLTEFDDDGGPGAAPRRVYGLELDRAAQRNRRR